MKKVTAATQRMQGLITLGKTNKEILKALPKTSLQQIYNQRYFMKKARGAKLVKKAPASAKTSPARIPQEDEAMNKIANDIQIGGTHYKEKELQPWDAISAWGCGFLDGNVIKYVVRYRSKGGVEDLKKARHYLDKLIEIMEKQ